MKKLYIFFLIILISCTEDYSDKIKSGSKEAGEIAARINSDFRKIRIAVSDLAVKTKEIILHADKYAELEPKNKYKAHSTGVLYKPGNDGGSALYLSAATNKTKEVWQYIRATASLDSAFKHIIESSPEIAQVYYNDRYNMNRIYPFIDVIGQYPVKLVMKNYNFYYLADRRHNPERKAVWVNDPYVDPAGRGWMVSVITPVYYKNELLGVPGIDVTINTIFDRYIPTAQKNIMIIDRKGVLVTAPENIVSLLSMPPLKKHKYIETIKSDTYREDDYNLFKSRMAEVRNAAKMIIKEGNRLVEMKSEKMDYIIISEPIKEIEWTICKFIERN